MLKKLHQNNIQNDVYHHNNSRNFYRRFCVFIGIKDSTFIETGKVLNFKIFTSDKFRMPFLFKSIYSLTTDFKKYYGVVESISSHIILPAHSLILSTRKTRWWFLRAKMTISTALPLFPQRLFIKSS